MLPLKINGDAFMVRQFQNLVTIKTVLLVVLCDSDLKYNFYTSVIKTHRASYTIRGTWSTTIFFSMLELCFLYQKSSQDRTLLHFLAHWLI